MRLKGLFPKPGMFSFFNNALKQWMKNKVLRSNMLKVGHQLWRKIVDIRTQQMNRNQQIHNSLQCSLRKALILPNSKTCTAKAMTVSPALRSPPFPSSCPVIGLYIQGFSAGWMYVISVYTFFKLQDRVCSPFYAGLCTFLFMQFKHFKCKTPKNYMNRSYKR